MIPYFSFEKFTIGLATFHLWGLFVSFGALAVFYLAKKEGIKKQLVTDNQAYTLFLWVFVGLIAGARLLFCIQFPKHYFVEYPLDIFKLWEGGMFSYGGIFGGIIAGFIYAKKERFSTHKIINITDTIAPYIPLGIATGRVANLLSNEHQGGLTKVAWGIIWPDGSIRHPIAAYLIIAALIAFIIMQIMKRKLHKRGQISLVFLLLYSLSRFLLDFLRASGTELSNPQVFGIRNAQWISLGMFFFSAFLLWLQARKPLRKKIVK